MRVVALIPARCGSKRVKNKNIRPLNGHPLIAYSIHAAKMSGVFDRILVSTDSQEIASVAKQYGAEVPFLRPERLATDLSADIEWIQDILQKLASQGYQPECFSILRPTSPFRSGETIRRAWEQFVSLSSKIDSQRAVEKCRQHPAKMWRIEGELMRPFFEGKNGETPWHSSPYQSLPQVYVQNASLEIAWCRMPLEYNSIAGERIAPFLTRDLEGFDINEEEDWWLAEKYAQDQELDLS